MHNGLARFVVPPRLALAVSFLTSLTASTFAALWALLTVIGLSASTVSRCGTGLTEVYGLNLIVGGPALLLASKLGRAYNSLAWIPVLRWLWIVGSTLWWCTWAVLFVPMLLSPFER